MARWAAIAIWAATALCPVARADASDLDLHWSAPAECPGREQLRETLSRALGRDIALGADAPLSMVVTIAAESGGYELALETRAANGSDAKRLQAQGCGELFRASVLVATLLLGGEPGWSSANAADSDDRGDRDWFIFLRGRALADAGSVAPLSLGAGIGLGFGLHRTRVEFGGLWLPGRELRAQSEPDAIGVMQLLAASAAVCQEFFTGVTLAPCVHMEFGRLTGRGRRQAPDSTASATWLLPGVGARAQLPLWRGLFLSLDVIGGVPLHRPKFAVRGAGTVYEVAPVIGRLELSIEGRL